MPNPSKHLRFPGGSIMRVVWTMAEFHNRFGLWPTEVVVPRDFRDAIRDELLTAEGLQLLTMRVKLTPKAIQTVRVQGRLADESAVVCCYDDLQHLPGATSADVAAWIGWDVDPGSHDFASKFWD